MEETLAGGLNEIDCSDGMGRDGWRNRGEGEEGREVCGYERIDECRQTKNSSASDVEENTQQNGRREKRENEVDEEKRKSVLDRGECLNTKRNQQQANSCEGRCTNRERAVVVRRFVNQSSI